MHATAAEYARVARVRAGRGVFGNAHLNAQMQERDALRARVASKLRADMSNLLASPDHADVVLIASDGVRVPAHVAVVRQVRSRS